MRRVRLVAALSVWLSAAALAAQAPTAAPAAAPTAAPAAARTAQPASEAPSWLRSANANVEAGNRALLSGDAEAALKRYDAAARELPSEAGVHLNRGLALLAKKEVGKAREALLLATQPPGSADVRADAYYNLGSAFYAEADAAAGKEDHAQAQQLFRDSVDALKRALKLRPGDRSAAWNLELAQRRLREQEEKQKEQQEKQDQEKQDQQQQDQQQPQQDQQKQDQQDQQQPQDPQQQDQQKQPDQQQQDQQKQDQQKQQDQQQQQQQQEQQQQQQQQQAEPQPPSEATRALDALQAGEESLEKLQARQRAMRERRAPAKDW
jgi:hypothetical protein